jgi:quercetin dioxygenase-like cupin family protein
MKINYGRVAGRDSWREDEIFTGKGWVDPVLSDVDEVAAYNVFFTPEARTNWHRHLGGQMLLITAGSGVVVSRQSGAIHVRAGDIVWTEPNEEHWHGASPLSYLSHFAVSLGDTQWLEAVDDDSYAAVDASFPTVRAER